LHRRGSYTRRARGIAGSAARASQCLADDGGRKSAMKNGLYIYGMIAASDAQDFGNIGIGNEATSVQTIAFQDVAAVVSRSPFMVYDTLAKETIVKDLVMHQFILEKVMSHFSIIPVKFGTMVETEDEVVRFLGKGYPLLSAELSKQAEKIELDVVANWELSNILPTIYRHNDQVQKKQSAIAQQGKAVSVAERVELGKLIEQALTSTKAEYQQLIAQNLQEVTLEICLHDMADEQMIFNAAFLLEKKNAESFNQRINDLDRKLENTVNFRIVGPLPVYSFSTIVLEQIGMAQVEEAREILALQGQLTAKSVRDAYHQLAQKYHPDKNNSEESAQFPQINAAYRTLKKFMENGLLYVGIYRWEKDSTV
jgi:hypothetical protein